VHPFLEHHDWSVLESITGDVSPRKYTRVEKSGRTAIFMDCCDELTDRPGLKEFVQIGSWLRDVGIRVPEIYEVDQAQKCLLLEDFGGVSFSGAIRNGMPKQEMYTLAADVLSYLRDVECLLALPRYHDTRVHALHREIIDWFLPTQRDVPGGTVESYLSVWEEIEKTLPEVDYGFLHMDYHLENMMFLPDEHGIAQCGLIDFQDASIGPVPYDLANLLLDARVSVPEDIQNSILRSQSEEFMAWYVVLATQFHCRVIGLFTKLAVRDRRPEYMVHVPRLANYIHGALKHPVLRPLCTFFNDLGVDFTHVKDLNTPQDL